MYVSTYISLGFINSLLFDLFYNIKCLFLWIKHVIPIFLLTLSQHRSIIMKKNLVKSRYT